MDFCWKFGLTVVELEFFKDKPSYAEDLGGSDEELDPYKETLKQEARDKEAAAESDDTDSEDR